MALGDILRKARESRKLTASEVAAATHMKVQTVEAIEHEDFSKMPAAIYCKGFIKLYAEYMGLDADPLTREYVERFVSPPPEPEAEEPEEEHGIFNIGFHKKEDPVPEAQEEEDDTDHPDLFSYGEKRTEEPPEKLFDHTPPPVIEEEEEKTPSPSFAERLSGISSKISSAAISLKERIQAAIPERKTAGQAAPELPEDLSQEPEVDISPIKMVNKQVFIISGAVAGIILIVFLISVLARFASDNGESEIPEFTEQELVLPVEPPPPYID